MATLARASRVATLLVAAVLLPPTLGGCTPRLAHASLENGTSSEVVVLSPWQEPLGTVPAGESADVEVGPTGHCLPGLLVLTADYRSVATLSGPICEDDDVAVAEARFVPTGAATVVNATGTSFTVGTLGSVEIGALGTDETRVVALPGPAGECVEVWVQLRTTGPRGVSVVAEFNEGDRTAVCDGDVVTLEPWDVQDLVGRDWVRRASPPPSGPATVTVTNDSPQAVELLLDGVSSALLYPGEDAVLDFPAPAVRCSNVRLERRGLDGEPVLLASYVCAGDHFTMDDRWPDGLIVVSTEP